MAPFFRYRNIPTPEGRRKVLLDYILLFLGLLAAAGLFTTLLVEPGLPGHSSYIILLFVTLAFLALAFFLNRIGRTSTASWLVAATSIVAPWWAILHDASILSGDSFPLAYLTLSVLLCGMLMHNIAAVLAAVFNLAGLVAVRILVPSVVGYNWPSIFLFLLTATLITVVYNSLSRADLRQTREVLDMLREDEKKIRDLSSRDPLTGTWNRRFMDETLPHVCALATRDGRTLSFIMADLDHFKSINDRFGHPVGDLVLAGVARAILDCVRESDLVFRYGGDEFLVVLPESTREVALRCIDRIQEAVHSVALPPEMAGEAPIHLTCGLAVHSDGTADPRALVAEADHEMYRVKNAK